MTACDLARSYRESGLYDVALLFAERAIAEAAPSEDISRAIAEIATSGWHSKRPEMREWGARLCEELALSREFPEAAREVAWRNLFWYRKRLSDLAPSVSRQRIHFRPPAGFALMNPSIVNGPEGMVMNVRCVNYRIGEKNPGPTITRNFLLGVDPMFKYRELGELDLGAFPQVDERVQGLEDLRLWYMDDDLWASSTSRQHNQEGMCEMVAVAIGGIKVAGWVVLDPKVSPKRHQKNWMPIADGSGRFIYSCDPTTVVGCRLGDDYDDFVPKLRAIGTPPVSARFWRGSSQAIPFDGGFLAIIHECPRDLDPILHKPPYQQRFVWFDQTLQIRKLSWGWEFGHDSNGEYVCGMCEHPDGERLVISYGVLDREAWVATVLKDEVRAALRDA